MTFRRRYLFLALAGIVLIAAGSVPWPADRLPFRAELAEQAEAAFGHSVASSASTITLLPLPRIDFHSVVIGPDTPGESILRAEKVSARLGLWRLLSGRAEAEQVTIHNPRVMWDGSQRPRDLWQLARERLIAVAMATDTAGPPLPARVSVVDGTVLARGGARTLLRRLNASVTWPSANRLLDFNATAVWRGEPVDLRIDKLHPASLAAGLQSPVVLRFSAQPVSFSFAGVIGADDLPAFDGLVNFRTGSLGRATAWLRTPLTFSRNAGQMSIKSTARLTGEGLSMPDVRIEIEGGTLEGALAARRSDAGRMLVSATLDAATLDFNRFLAVPLRLLAEGRGPLHALPGNDNDDDANDVDVRLSISRAQFGPLEMQDVAAGILVSNGRMEFALNQARLENGSVRGRLQLVPGRDDMSARLTGAFEGIDAQRTLHRLFGGALFSGPASGSITLAARGQSARLMAAGLSGSISARIEGGNLLGVDLADVITRSRHSPLATALDWRGGRTAFRTVESTLVINEGNGRLEGALKADGIVGMITGDVGIAHHTLDLRAYVRQAPTEADAGKDAGAQSANAIGFPIEISGSWDYPIVTPDIRMLIERSSAVAPLLPGETREAPHAR
ncbi:AsmA family protein [Pseudochelatococcus sp. B33]